MTTTAHLDFSPAGFSFVKHADPACPFIAEAIDAEGDLSTAHDCNYCVGGLKFDPPIRATWLDRDGATEIEIAEGNYKRPVHVDPDAPKLTAEERFARVCAWLVELDRKVEVRDIDHMRKSVATTWLRTYDGDFSFLVDLRAKGGVKSDGQAKGVLNCLRAQLLRTPAAKPAKVTTPTQVAPSAPAKIALDISTIPAGRYAYEPTTGQAQFVVVNRPTEGKWAGCTFVKAQHGGNEERAGFQGATSTAYRGTHEAALAAVMTNPQAAMELYGKLLGRCGHCNRELTNEASREAGIGPVCAKRMGWAE